MSHQLCLDDILLVAGFALFLSISSFSPSLILKGAVFAFAACYGLLVWLDTMLFVQYRIEVNRQTVAWFFTGSKGIVKGLPHLLAAFNKFQRGAFIQLMWLGVLFYSLFLPLGEIHLSIFVIIVAIGGLSFIWDKIELVAMLILSALFYYLATAAMNSVGCFLYKYAAFASVTIFLALGILSLFRRVIGSDTSFFTTPTLLANILFDDRLHVESDAEITPELAKLVPRPTKKHLKSDYYGACAGSNIILVTVESLGAYVNPYVKNAAKSKIAERLKDKCWFSEQHFCLCPNTTVSTNQIYTGAYSNNPYNKDDSPFPGKDPKHIKHLKQQGYKTLFLDSADIALYDYYKLLDRIGFDRVWGTSDIPANGLRADYRLWNMVDVIAEEVSEQPFYLHLINDQTHMPYEVIDKGRFNRHEGHDQKSAYLNAVEEVDFIIDEFLVRLGKRIDLTDTMIVFTGDHGESFGEYGYSFHSNSVIKQQVQVPFMLHHPNLKSKIIQHSSHFDLFPTFFDLLGVEFDYSSLGQSIGHEPMSKHYFFHSATLKGNTPANFGLLIDDEMFWIDRLFNKQQYVNHTELKMKEPNSLHSDYYRVLSHIANKHGLVKGV